MHTQNDNNSNNHITEPTKRDRKTVAGNKDAARKELHKFVRAAQDVNANAMRFIYMFVHAVYNRAVCIFLHTFEFRVCVPSFALVESAVLHFVLLNQIELCECMWVCFMFAGVCLFVCMHCTHVLCGSESSWCIFRCAYRDENDLTIYDCWFALHKPTATECISCGRAETHKKCVARS